MTTDTNNCKPCTDNVFTRLSSNPDILALLDAAKGKPHDIVGDGEYIFVDTVETDDLKTDTIRYEPYTPLTINSFTDDQSLLLKGFELTDYVLDWIYNKEVESHSMDQGVVPPAPVPAQLVYTLPVSGVSVTTDTTITLTADDIDGDSNPAKTANTSILFGNYIYQTQLVVTERDDIDASLILGLTLVDLTKIITRSKNFTFTCSSDATEYEVILIPSAYGLSSGASFKDLATNFTGGWGRLVSNLELVNENNNAGGTENYDVWVASNRNLNTLQFQIS